MFGVAVVQPGAERSPLSENDLERITVGVIEERCIVSPRVFRTRHWALDARRTGRDCDRGDPVDILSRSGPEGDTRFARRMLWIVDQRYDFLNAAIDPAAIDQEAAVIHVGLTQPNRRQEGVVEGPSSGDAPHSQIDMVENPMHRVLSFSASAGFPRISGRFLRAPMPHGQTVEVRKTCRAGAPEPAAASAEWPAGEFQFTLLDPHNEALFRGRY